MILKRTLIALILTAGLTFAADPALLQLVTRDARMVAGIDFSRAKNSPFGQKILAEMKEEDQGFQKLVTSTGFDPRRDLQEVVIASSGVPKQGGTVVLVRGVFDQTKISQFLRSEGAVQSLYKGVELWKSPKDKSGEGAIAFVNTSLAIFGTDATVRAAIDRNQAAGEGMTADLAVRVSEWSARNDAWFVSNASLQEMGVGKTGQNAILPGGLTVDSIRQASGGVRFGSTVDVSGELTTRSDQDAQALADVFRFISSMVRLNADKPGAAEAQKIVDSLQLSTSGPAMKFSLSVTEEQLERMLENKKKAASKVAARRGPEVI